LAAVIGGIFAVVGSAVGAFVSSHAGAAAPAASPAASVVVSAPAPETAAPETAAPETQAPPTPSLSPTAELLPGQGTPPGPSSVYTLLWHEPVTINAGGLLFEPGGPEPPPDPIDSELYYYTTQSTTLHGWFIGTYGKSSTRIFYLTGSQPAPAGCNITLNAIGQRTEAGAAYCVFNFYTKTVVYLRVTGFTPNGSAVAADATEWSWS
jgi:hypothetical protein